MDKEIKKKWIEALRSEKYQQGGKVLRDIDDNFCCLGVLVDITFPECWKKEEMGPARCKCWVNKESNDKKMVSVLHPNQRTKINLKKGEESELISMNDNYKSFKEIADWIEENL